MEKTTRRPLVKGTVVKRSSDQTIRVAVKITRVHPIYQKRYSQLRYYLAHDPENKYQTGESVTLISCRPLSKRKHWQVLP